MPSETKYTLGDVIPSGVLRGIRVIDAIKHSHKVIDKLVFMGDIEIDIDARIFLIGTRNYYEKTRDTLPREPEYLPESTTQVEEIVLRGVQHKRYVSKIDQAWADFEKQLQEVASA